jgi:hypothetical protein
MANPGYGELMPEADDRLVVTHHRGTISLPVELCVRRGLDEDGVLVRVHEREDGVIELHPHQEVPGPDQAWFWTPEWQQMEREADEAIADGRVYRFDSTEEMMVWMRSVADGGD